MASRLGSQPTTARRGVPSVVGATRAWISTRSGRAPSTPANTAAPGLGGAVATGQEQRRGVRHLGEAAAGHLEHADLVGRAEAVLGRAQQAEGVRAVALEREDRVDHMLDDARAGDLAVLGHMPDEQQRRAARLGEADQRLSGAAHLAHRPGRRIRSRRSTWSGSN